MGMFITHTHTHTSALFFSTRSCCMSVNRNRWRPPGSTEASSSLWALIHIMKHVCFPNVVCNDLFHIQVQPSNYCTFYDDQRHNWSLMFESEKAATDFSKEVCVLWVLRHLVLCEEILMQQCNCFRFVLPKWTVAVRWTLSWPRIFFWVRARLWRMETH